MHSRVLIRFYQVIAAAVVGLGALVPGMRADASTTSPVLEIVFPQKTGPTQFTSSFGDYRSGGRRHQGNDLLAPRMTEVYAVADGTISFVGISHLSGRNVRIAHGDGWESYYLHLNNDNPGTDDGDAPWTLTVAPGVEEGMTVRAGQLIGWVGDSGNAEWTTPHTHFELHHDGRAVDPYDMLIEAYGRAAARDDAVRFFTEVPGYDVG